MIRRLALLAVVASSLGCESKPPTREVVCLLDTSGSIIADARASMVNTIQHAAQLLARGDALTIVPVVGETTADTPGHILRLRWQSKREPYDGDRPRFLGEVKTRTDGFIKNLTSSPAEHTDLLGSFDIAAEELPHRASAERSIVCLSDFLQDDSRLDFRRDVALSDSRHAEQAATAMATHFGRRFAGVDIYLGQLQSTDLRRLPSARQLAVRAFWTTFLTAQGAVVVWKTDGLGHVEEFMAQTNASADLPR